MTRIAIVGGGPGGLFSASLLEQYCADLCEVTLFEAGPRLGGKVLTRQFDTAPVTYEAGVAEIYDYSHAGPDPLKKLVRQLGLSTVRMKGPAVILGDAILRNYRDVQEHFGRKTRKTLQAFYRLCEELCTPEDYYEGHSQDDNKHPWANRTFKDVLDEIPDEIARRYVEVAARSDVATESHKTNALDGLKNVLMDDPRYLRLYSIVGGIQRLTDELASRLKCPVLLETPATRIARNSDGTYRLTVRSKGRFEEHDFDLVVLALPNYWLQCLDWGSRELRLAMQKHLAHYDSPAHYLRMTLLFRQPFWREQVPGSYFMMDAFGGCCLYDEGARHPCEPYGALGWLLAGNDAMALSNYDDERLIRLALDSLPAPLAHGRELYLEGKVQRWVGTINGLPGGNPTHDIKVRHVPEPHRHPGLFVVGDYLFDSTLNGTFDSADYVTDRILTLLRKRKAAARAAVNGSSTPAAAAPDPVRPLDSVARTPDLIRTVWGWKAPYRLLISGPGDGVQPNRLVPLDVTSSGLADCAEGRGAKGLLGDLRRLPFADNAFDFVYDNSLCYLPEADLDQAIRELYRVCRVGVYFAGLAADLTQETIETPGMLNGVRSLCTIWEWSEMFVSAGFRIAVTDPRHVARVWKVETKANAGRPSRYFDADSLRHCLFTRPNAPAAPVAARPLSAAAKTV
jgi:monoamine oxidase